MGRPQNLWILNLVVHILTTVLESMKKLTAFTPRKTYNTMYNIPITVTCNYPFLQQVWLKRRLPAAITCQALVYFTHPITVHILYHSHTQQSTLGRSRSSYLRHFISITKCLVRLYKTCRTTAMKWKSPWIGKEAIIIHQASILKKTTQISKNIQPLNPSLAHPRTIRPSSPSSCTAAQHCTLTCVWKCFFFSVKIYLQDVNTHTSVQDITKLFLANQFTCLKVLFNPVKPNDL
jgi:hypothetical protein